MFLPVISDTLYKSHRRNDVAHAKQDCFFIEANFGPLVEFKISQTIWPIITMFYTIKLADQDVEGFLIFHLNKRPNWEKY